MILTPEIFDEFYCCYASLLYGFILSKISDENIAGQVFTAVITDAVLHLPPYDPEKLRLYSWLQRWAQKHIEMRTVYYYP